MQHAKSHNLGQTCFELQFPCTITPAQYYLVSSFGNANCWTNIFEMCEMCHNDVYEICDMCLDDIYEICDMCLDDIFISEPELHFNP